ncbi:MAG: hypothetical protein AAF564_24200 [Bacteroidota bacterium]
MKTQVIVKELEEIARQLGLGIRKGKGNFKGGRCVVGGQDLIVLNRHHLPEIHLSVLAEGLRDLPVEDVFMKPAVRKALEEVWDAKLPEQEEAASTEEAEAAADDATEGSSAGEGDVA